MSQFAASDALTRLFPKEAEWVNDFYSRLGSVKNLGELDDVRKFLNDRVKATYNSPALTSEETGKVGAMRAALDHLRNAYYGKLEEATGLDLRGLKRTEGAVIDARTAAAANESQLKAGHQGHIEPGTPGQTAAKVLKGAKGVVTGGFTWPVLGYVTDALGGSKLNEFHAYLKRALSDLPPPNTPQAAAPPAPIPPNRPKIGPPGPGNSIQVTRPQMPVQPPPSSVSYPNPTGVAAPAPVPQMGTTPGYQLPSGPAAYAGPNTVNRATAIEPTVQTNLEAAKARANALVDQVRGRGFTVDKEGKIKSVPAGELPGKATKPKGKKGKGPVAAVEPYKSPAQMTDEWAQG